MWAHAHPHAYVVLGVPGTCFAVSKRDYAEVVRDYVSLVRHWGSSIAPTTSWGYMIEPLREMARPGVLVFSTDFIPSSTRTLRKIQTRALLAGTFCNFVEQPHIHFHYVHTFSHLTTDQIRYGTIRHNKHERKQQASNS